MDSVKNLTEIYSKECVDGGGNWKSSVKGKISLSFQLRHWPVW